MASTATEDKLAGKAVFITGGASGPGAVPRALLADSGALPPPPSLFQSQPRGRA